MIKVFETKDAIKNGADEIDMVINVAALKDKEKRFNINLTYDECKDFVINNIKHS